VIHGDIAVVSMQNPLATIDRSSRKSVYSPVLQPEASLAVGTGTLKILGEGRGCRGTQDSIEAFSDATCRVYDQI